MHFFVIIFSKSYKIIIFYLDKLNTELKKIIIKERT